MPEFSIDWSWLLAASVRRPVALALSMALLAAFWDTVLVIGIDLALLVIAVTRPAWADRLIQ